MSIKAMEWAGDIRVGKGSHKAVLLALAWFHHEKKNECCRSIAAIVAWTELNRKTVIAALEWLEKAGLIATEKRLGALNNYRLNFDSTGPKNGTGKKQGASTNFGTGQTSEPVPKTGPVPNLGPVPKTETDQYQKRTKPVPNLEPDRVGKDIGMCVLPAREGINQIAWEQWHQHLVEQGRTITASLITKIQNILGAYDQQTQQDLIDFAITGTYANLEAARGNFTSGKNQRRNGQGPGQHQRQPRNPAEAAAALRERIKPIT